ncbi:flavin-containing monooxygenase [Ilumatobacter sp.]|uniref:flavin-containing monooxygenase n=1 Tax=Ilumatobacter sp. TaxID=1967498 RepID=UPI003C46CD66
MSLYEQLKDQIDFGFDPDDLAAKYAEERNKRVRTDFDQQFVRVGPNARSESFVADPYTPLTPRDAVDENVEVIVLGGGWVGLLAAARLKEAGHTNIRIIEGAGDFGGTWYWNRYPGAQCDVQSYVYLPLLEETGYVPKERYSYAPEIYEHAQRIGKHFDLYEDALFHTWITDMRWDEAAAHWTVATNRGDTIRAQFATIGTGPAARPRLPGIPGLDDFTGHTFHTSRWDYDYTGGDTTGGLTKLADKRVAVIGTGATGIQVVPHVGEWAKETYVFQRTPSTVSPRGNESTPEWFTESMPSDWQSQLLRDFDQMSAGNAPREKILEGESLFRIRAYLDQIRSHVDMSTFDIGQMKELADLADYMCMTDVRARVDEIVTDKDDAELLKPWYGFFCKRPTFSDNYLPTFNCPNVTLVDVSSTKGVERITEKGLVANGVEYEVDCIIYASGFEITSDFKQRMTVPIHGIGGEPLVDHWDDGYRTMHGIMSHGFPNLFVLGGLFSQTLSPNYCSPLDGQARHVAYIVDTVGKRGNRAIQPSAEAEEAFVHEQLEPGYNPLAVVLGGAPETCTPGYYNQEGRPAGERRDNRLEGYVHGSAAYWSKLEGWREDDELDGLEVIEATR